MNKVASAIRKAKPHFVVVHGGRSSGKTFGIAAALVLRATLERTSAVVIRATQVSIRESVQQSIELAIQHLGLWGWKTGVRVTEHENGSRIVYHGLGPASAAGIRSIPNIDIAWIDEAQYVEEQPLRTLLPTVREKNSQIVFSLNPLDPEGAVYRDFVAEPLFPDLTLCVQANYDSNHWLDETMLAQIEAVKKADHDRYLHEFMGHPLLLTAAQVFRMGEDAHWHCADIDAQVPENAKPLYGLDIGMGKHPSVILRVLVWDGTIYVQRECTDYDLRQDSLESFVAAVGVGVGDVVWADHQALPWNRAPGGWALRHVRKVAGGEDRGVKWIKSRHMVVHPTCKTTLYQLPRYSLKIDKDGNVLPEYDESDDDAVDCVRYACHEAIYKMDGPKSVARRMDAYY